MVQLVARSTVSRYVVGSSPHGAEHFDSIPPVLRDWVIKCLSMYNRVYATGHIKDPVPLIEKRRGLSPGSQRFSHIHISHKSHVLRLDAPPAPAKIQLLRL